MGSERPGKFLVVSLHLSGRIEILLMAFIVLDREVVFESRPRRVDICLSKRNTILIEKILSTMKPIVLAHDQPAVAVISPHTSLLWAILWIGPWNQRGEEQSTFDAESDQCGDPSLQSPA
jgi:hypothetical protein